ncbi:hypothetical protein BG006_006136 [Podila minutissima]|uniref:Uncharacterized protein n=1 Tax=Podila minutissima TaxID=64525 RepID=A0A9P5SNF9_9FUNG|nr:hypothetical protein BG006_006136 [Podila minutissima]
MASPLTNNSTEPPTTPPPLSNDENTRRPLAQSKDAIRPQSYFKSTVQYSSAIALGQTIYILSVILSLAQFAVAHAQVLMLTAQEQKLLTENISPSETPSSQGIAVTDKDKTSPTAVITPITRERYSSRIKQALVKTLSGNFAPVALKRVTFDDEPIIESRNEDRHQHHRPPTRISEEDIFFATSPTVASPPTSPTGPGIGISVRKASLTHSQKSTQPLTKFDRIQRTQPTIERANAANTTTATKKPSLAIFSLSSKSTTPSIAGGLRGINAIGSLGVAPQTKSTIATIPSITQNTAIDGHGLRRSISAPSKNSPALRNHMESRESVAQTTVVQTEEKFSQEEEAVEMAEKMTFSFFVTETLPDVIVSPHSPTLAPISRLATPSSDMTLTEVKTNEIEPPTSRNSLSVTALGTRARRSLSLVRNRPSSILGDDDMKELEVRSRRRSVQLEFPPDFLTAPNSGGSAMECQGSVGKSAGKGFLYKIAHPHRYKREQQEELQLKRSASPFPPLANAIELREQISIKEPMVVNDSSSIRSLPPFAAPPAPAPQQRPRPSTPQPATVFPSWPEYVDHLDSSETVHSAIYFPLSQPASHAPDANLAAMMPPPSTRSSLLRRSRIFMDKPEDDDHTSFAAFGHPSSFSTPPSSDTSSVVVRPSFFTRSSSTASSEVSTLATTPYTSPRPSLSLNGGGGSRPIMLTGSSSGKNPASFGIATALAGATGVSTAMAGGVARRPDEMSSRGKGFNGDGSASEYSVASSMQSTDSEGRGRSGFVKKLGLKN